MLLATALAYVATAWADNDQRKHADVTQLAQAACSGLPDSADVTITQTVGGIEGASTNTVTTTIHSVTVNCGNLQSSSTPGPSGSGNKSGSGGGNEPKL